MRVQAVAMLIILLIHCPGEALAEATRGAAVRDQALERALRVPQFSRHRFTAWRAAWRTPQSDEQAPATPAILNPDAQGQPVGNERKPRRWPFIVPGLALVGLGTTMTIQGARMDCPKDDPYGNFFCGMGRGLALGGGIVFVASGGALLIVGATRK